MKDLFTPPSSLFIKQERSKARALKKTRWWKQKLAAGICYHCHNSFCSEDLTMDHLTPIARGGRTGKNNIVPSCKDCNSKKSYKSLLDVRLKSTGRT